MQFTTYTAAAVLAFCSAAQAQNVFQSAFDKLTEQYLPTDILSSVESPVMSAASAAKVTGDFSSILPSALQASSVPEWFSKAWPTQYNSQYEALTGAVAEIKTAATSAEEAQASQTENVATTVKDGVTSVVTGARSEITDKATSVKSEATEKASEAKSKATEAVSSIKDGAASITSEIASKVTGDAENAAERLTAAYGAAALGAMGLVMAL